MLKRQWEELCDGSTKSDGIVRLAFESQLLFCQLYHLGEVMERSEFQFPYLYNGGNCIHKVV